MTFDLGLKDNWVSLRDKGGKWQSRRRPVRAKARGLKVQSVVRQRAVVGVSEIVPAGRSQPVRVLRASPLPVPSPLHHCQQVLTTYSHTISIGSRPRSHQTSCCRRNKQLRCRMMNGAYRTCVRFGVPSMQPFDSETYILR